MKEIGISCDRQKIIRSIRYEKALDLKEFRMYQAGLILEGGGMKGAYTSGVLDYFLEKGVEFSSCYGVSSGAVNLCSFLSKQKKRGFKSLTGYMGNSRYCGLYSLITDGNIVNSQFSMDLIPNYLLPFDGETYDRYTGKAYAVATNIESGEPEYLPMKKMPRDLRAVQASTALPLVFQTVDVDGKLYLDGGIADSIPIRKSVMDGNGKNVIILTKEVGYVRQPDTGLSLIRMCYHKYPKIYEVMKERHTTYNETMNYIRRLEKEGKAFVIQPKVKSNVGRLEKDEEKMLDLYDDGYEDAKTCYDSLLEFLNN